MKDQKHCHCERLKPPLAPPYQGEKFSTPPMIRGGWEGFGGLLRRSLSYTCSLLAMTALLISCFLIISSLSPVYADEPSITPAPTPVAYQLPYPGLLPDNPLYFLKALRDSVEGFLISSPLQKADFDLLQADKRVNASYLLLTQENGKEALAATTFSKAENYFEDAISKATEAKKQGMDIHDVVKRLTVANLKHKEVLGDIENLNKHNKQTFRQDEERLQDLGKKVKAMRP